MAERRILLAILFTGLLLLPLLSLQAQSYPVWFLRQGVLNCSRVTVGYANVGFYHDSSVALAYREACDALVRQRSTRIFGGQAFWSTEYGTFWMGDDFREEFAAFGGSVGELKLLDTAVTSNVVLVLASDPDCIVAPQMRAVLNLNRVMAPTWTSSPPDDKHYYYAVGLAPEYFYETSSWREAERLARRNLARAVHVTVKGLQKVSGEGQEVRHEELSVTLRNIEVVARWRDTQKKIFYVLARMPK